MKPNRPGSAKSTHTRVTVDSDLGSNALNASKFSETYSNGVRMNNQKNNDFHKYVSEKNKDPRFKKFLDSKMPEIPEKMDASLELSKLTSKPFQRKSSKPQPNQAAKNQAKVEEAPQRKRESSKPSDKKQPLLTGKSFIDKSKQKLKVGSKKEMEQENCANTTNETNGILQGNNGNVQDRVNLAGFTIKIPGKPVQVISASKQKVETKQKTAQEIERDAEKEERQKLFSRLSNIVEQREKLFTESSHFVEELETRNMEYYPNQYEAFVSLNMSRVNEDMDFSIEKINIQDFMEEPSERDYDKLMRRINDNDQMIEGGRRSSEKSHTESSVNLEEIIDGTEKEGESDNDISVFMSSMSASDVKERNMFLTECLKGKRVTSKQMNCFHQNEQSMLKLKKLEGLPKEQEDEVEEEQEVYLTDLQQLSTVSSKSMNMTKKKNSKFMERNKIEAAGDLYRECDYLTPEEQKRIDDLINGVPLESPFQFSDMEAFRNRRIDEGIKIHREMHASGSKQDDENVINEAALPKDPLLRKQAELKILKDKINSVNSRLRSVDEVVVSKTKIKALAEKLKQVTKLSKMGESLIQQKNRQVEQDIRKMKQAEQLIIKAEKEKDEITTILKEMEQDYKEMERELQKIRQMDEQELRKMYQDELREKRRKVDDVERDAQGLKLEMDEFLSVGDQIRSQLQVLDGIMSQDIVAVQCEGYREGETVEELDQLITIKWEAAEQAVKDLKGMQ